MEMKDLFFVGRQKESKTLLDMLDTERSDLVTILGRRRIGKTFMVKSVLGAKLDFHFTGIRDTDQESLLVAFSLKLSETAKSALPFAKPNNWLEAFELLKNYLKSIKPKVKKVIFIDEFPWIDTHRSGFLSAFEYFWNDWAVNENIMVIICGSNSAWMKKNIHNNKGGLHNRVTKYIALMPFTLQETKEFFLKKQIDLPNYDIVQIYMAMGGVPYYLQEIIGGDSAIQNIDRALFSSSSTLKNEFKNLYRSLFDNYEKHETIVKALATKQKGLTREELIQATQISNGGGLTKILNDLEESNFICSINPFGKQKKDMLYRLIDEYSIFYYRFNPQRTKEGTFIQNSTTNKYHSWAGIAFESLCLKHINQVKEALGISGIMSNESSFYHKENDKEEGFQIDLLIDRSDNCINICEMKWYSNHFELNTKEAELLRKRRELFREFSKTKKYLINTIISSYGVKTNASNMSIVEKVVTMDDLFGR